MSALSKGQGLSPTSSLTNTGEGLTAPNALTNVDVAAGSTSTWSVTNKNASVALSNGNRTATGAGTTNVYRAGRSDTSITGTQKMYWECHIDSLTGTIGESAVGVCNVSNTFDDGAYLGVQATAMAYYDDGTVIQNNATLTTLAVPVAGNTICIALDRGNNKIWFRIGNGGWNNDVIANQNPASNIGGLSTSTMGDVFPAYSVRLDVAASAYTLTATLLFAKPAGFTGLP